MSAHALASSLQSTHAEEPLVGAGSTRAMMFAAVADAADSVLDAVTFCPVFKKHGKMNMRIAARPPESGGGIGLLGVGRVA